MNVYVDVLFLVNFSMDFITLFISSLITHKPLYKLRIIVASVIGAIYGVLELFVEIHFLIWAIICVFVSLIMCVVAFKEYKIKLLTKIFVAFWCVSCVLGGVMSAVYTLFNKILSEFIVDTGYEGVYNGARLFIITALSIVLSLVLTKGITKNSKIKEAEMKIKFKNREYNIKALVDSGNMLKDPLTGRGVILLSSESELGKAVEKINDVYKRYIPFRSFGSEGLLKGVIPELIEINGRSIAAVIAPGKNDSYDGYEAIVPYALT